MLFEVPVAIKVGTTVTAFNRKYRVIHRGIVLAYDLNRCMYLVQFERKELGFEFCPDTEVASHGVPELLEQPAEVALDGSTMGGFSDPSGEPGSLLYGTCYFPYQNDWNERESAISVFKPPAPELTADSEGVLDEEDEKAIVVEKVAEREIVIKLIEVIDSAMKRKSMLLKCLSQCHDATGNNTDIDDSFKRHYSWLLANLRATCASLDSAMAHLQVMYGERYSQSEGVIQSDKQKNQWDATSDQIDRVTTSHSISRRVYAPWTASLLAHATKLGLQMTHDEQEQQRTQERILGASRLLLSTGYAGTFADYLEDQPVASMDAVQSMAEGVQELLHPKDPAHISRRLESFEDARFEAVKELQGALSGFCSELAALQSGTDVETE
mmetsp:Transcript_30124/g.69520  ORF Transcript_30124/g.69520 Transcript_30124/m.69520 type:complete len:383 (+) Transcript_30124:3-1151(+)